MQNAAILFDVRGPIVLTYQHSSQIPPLRECLIYLHDAHSRVGDFLKNNGRLMPNCALTLDLGQTKKKKIKQSQGWAQYLTHHALYSRLAFAIRNETVAS